MATPASAALQHGVIGQSPPPEPSPRDPSPQPRESLTGDQAATIRDSSHALKPGRRGGVKAGRGFQDDEGEIQFYDSTTRSGWYYFLRVFWCGCFEPVHTITSTYVKSERWSTCSRVTDSMAMENIYDIRREQHCCYTCLGCMPCCCCLNDMAALVLYGKDETNPEGQWRLVRVHNSSEVFDRVTLHLQDIHKDWRQTGVHMARKLEQVKYDINQGGAV